MLRIVKKMYKNVKIQILIQIQILFRRIDRMKPLVNLKESRPEVLKKILITYGLVDDGRLDD